MSARDDQARGAGFPRTARLCTPAEFKRVFEGGKRVSAGLFRLHVLLPDPSADAGGSHPAGARLGISVPKKVAALAVERNRIRRIVRECFRRQRGSLPAGDYALVAQREARGAAADMLRNALASLWRRAGALKPEPPAPTMPSPRHGPAAAGITPAPARVGPPRRSRSGPTPAARATRNTQDPTER